MLFCACLDLCEGCARAISCSPSFSTYGPCARANRGKMCMLRTVRLASTMCIYPGRVLLLCLFLDAVFLAYVYEMAEAQPTEEYNASLPQNLSVLMYTSHTLSSLKSSSTDESSSGASDTALTASPKFSSQMKDDRQRNEESQSEQSLNTTNSLQWEAQSLLKDKNKSSAEQNSNIRDRGYVDNNGGSMEHRSSEVKREFPMALVVASSVAAVSILVLFCLSYLWHTRQLDRRAQKLAIRLAAEGNPSSNCTQCRPVRQIPNAYARAALDSASDSGNEELAHAHHQIVDELDSLDEQDEESPNEEVGKKRLETTPVKRPYGHGRSRGRGRGSKKFRTRSLRKWSGHNGANRNSLITDQEILNHFASRRHSTFFI